MKKSNLIHLFGVVTLIALVVSVTNTAVFAKGGSCDTKNEKANSAKCDKNPNNGSVDNPNDSGSSASNNGKDNRSSQNPGTDARSNQSPHNNSSQTNNTNNTLTITTNDEGNRVLTQNHETLNVSNDGDPMVFKYSYKLMIFTDKGPQIARIYVHYVINANGDVVSEKSYIVDPDSILSGD